MTRDPTRLREAMRRAPRPLHERIARTHELEIQPLWQQPFADLQLRALGERLNGAVLEVACGAGHLTVELLRRHEGKGRLVATEASSALLERARSRSRGAGGPPLFLRVHDPAQKLPFAEETFDVVVAGPDVSHAPDPAAAFADLFRVTKPGGRAVIAWPLSSSFAEPLDLLDEVLARMGRLVARHALAQHRAKVPDAASLARALTEAGFEEVDVQSTRWELLFRSGREFFYAPLVETGPLPEWRTVASEDGDMLEVFLAWKETIDTYYQNRVFAVTVIGACASARKPEAPADSEKSA
ncbi:MAG TPA: class I SAM-dependent methyltransferase [Polyangia bacterium]